MGKNNNNKMKKMILKIMNYNENIHYDSESIITVPYTGNSNNCTLVHDSSIKSPEGLMYWRQANQLLKPQGTFPMLRGEGLPLVGSRSYEALPWHTRGGPSL